ncbi:hypothetical protein HN446_01220 [bacterium]|jgi:hypothetical protein|nr:hypothetical protein [bacterium]
MVDLKNAELIIGAISLFVSYLFSVSFSGWFRAWAASAVGDSTGKQLGFMTLNPLVHIDFVGVILLFLIKFGWGAHVPINPFNITYPRRNLKLFFAYLSDALAHFVLAIVALFFLVVFFGLNALHVSIPIMLSGVLSFPSFASRFPDISSLSIVVILIMVFAIYLNMILGVLYLIYNSFLCLFYIFYGETIYLSGKKIYLIFVPLLFAIFFAYPLRKYFLYMIYLLGCYWASFLGIS